uniref:Uncharacterized protein n=1 Tax=Oryza sativa subsp. japonica TaxID=39947 RepID=Q94H41_ORYSJ|nr:hypothetical protein [Oryza sativa Japonica Group]
MRGPPVSGSGEGGKGAGTRAHWSAAREERGGGTRLGLAQGRPTGRGDGDGARANALPATATGGEGDGAKGDAKAAALTLRTRRRRRRGAAATLAAANGGRSSGNSGGKRLHGAGAMGGSGEVGEMGKKREGATEKIKLGEREPDVAGRGGNRRPTWGVGEEREAGFENRIPAISDAGAGGRERGVGAGDAAQARTWSTWPEGGGDVGAAAVAGAVARRERREASHRETSYQHPRLGSLKFSLGGNEFSIPFKQSRFALTDSIPEDEYAEEVTVVLPSESPEPCLENDVPDFC